MGRHSCARMSSPACCGLRNCFGARGGHRCGCRLVASDYKNQGHDDGVTDRCYRSLDPRCGLLEHAPVSYMLRTLCTLLGIFATHYLPHQVRILIVPHLCALPTVSSDLVNLSHTLLKRSGLFLRPDRGAYCLAASCLARSARGGGGGGATIYGGSQQPYS